MSWGRWRPDVRVTSTHSRLFAGEVSVGVGRRKIFPAAQKFFTGGRFGAGKMGPRSPGILPFIDVDATMGRAVPILPKIQPVLSESGGVADGASGPNALASATMTCP